MKLKDKLLLESKEEPWVILHLEGMFWKAYEWSAFRFVKEIKAYKVKKRYVKQSGCEVAFLGFPQDSLSHVLSRDYSKVEVADTLIKLMVQGVYTESEFNAWKLRVEEVNKSVEPDLKGNLSRDLINTVEKDKSVNAEVLERLRMFQIEQSSPMQCMLFVSELQSCLNQNLKK